MKTIEFKADDYNKSMYGNQLQVVAEGCTIIVKVGMIDSSQREVTQVDIVTDALDSRRRPWRIGAGKQTAQRIRVVRLKSAPKIDGR